MKIRQMIIRGKAAQDMYAEITQPNHPNHPPAEYIQRLRVKHKRYKNKKRTSPNTNADG